ncbi:hypothetical protein [Arthrobacter sp. OAP107]|uniref:trypsin-like serine peptidase n=1 Tax=Arthrobacter sp. OAP107 TaxID=3156445 RepID=UPI003399BD11
MTSKRTLAQGLMSFSTALILALSSAGAATSAPASHDVHDRKASSTLIAQDSSAFWTPERMRAALPGDVLADKALARQNENAVASASGPQETASSTKIRGTSKSPRLRALHENEDPVSNIGKVFFTMSGQNFVCSGNSVVSENQSTVATAGHCVNEGPGAFATNFIFVPGYVDGEAPYGKWPARALFAPTQWSGAGDIRYDTGFAVVRPVDGELLADVVGSSGVQFNQPRGMDYKAYGYPAATPFNGQSLVSCTGTASNDSINPQFNSQGIDCDMTGGSSGGPWFVGDADGFQNSINSYGYGTHSTRMFGPYWGSVIQKVYNTASAAS